MNVKFSSIKNFFFILLLLLLFNADTVFAKDLLRTCNYTFSYELDKDGNDTAGAAAQQGGKIKVKIYSDGSHEGKGESNGEFLSENFGGKEEILNWGKSKNGASNIKTDDLLCPDYIGVIVVGLGDRQWYGFTSETIKTEAPKVSEHDNSDSMWVLKLDDLKDNNFICDYNQFTIETDFTTSNIRVDSKMAHLNMFYEASDELEDYWLNEREKNSCVAVYACGEVKGTLNYYYLYPDLYSAYGDGKNNCELTCIKGDDSCENTECPTMEGLKKDLLYYYINYEKDNTYLIQINNLKEKMRSVCHSMFDDLNYNEPCVPDCLELNEYFKEKDEKYLNITGSGSKCGFSGKLLIFIANIVKWVKYIIPVVAIILGILDFIKAIATDKDDEMKKAQGKFVKRLIAAALIFIIPFVIEFILEKMGFAANGCGIIDL